MMILYNLRMDNYFGYLCFWTQLFYFYCSILISYQDIKKSYWCFTRDLYDRLFLLHINLLVFISKAYVLASLTEIANKLEVKALK